MILSFILSTQQSYFLNTHQILLFWTTQLTSNTWVNDKFDKVVEILVACVIIYTKLDVEKIQKLVNTLHFDWILNMNCNWRAHWGKGIQNIQYRDCHKTFHDVAIDLEVLACFTWIFQCQVLTHLYKPTSLWPIHDSGACPKFIHETPSCRIHTLRTPKSCIVQMVHS